MNLILNNLNTLSKTKVYSKYNAAYDHKLGNFALRAFIKSLKHQKKSKRPTFIEELAKKFPYEAEEISHQSPCSITKRLNKTNNLFFKIENNEKLKIKSNKKPKRINITLNLRKNTEIDLSPNPCSYNPKYDYIFRRIPVTTIYKSPKKNKNKSSLKKIKLNKNINITEEKNKTHQINLGKRKLTHLRLNDKKSISLSKTSDTLKIKNSDILINKEDKSIKGEKNKETNCKYITDENTKNKEINKLNTLNNINKKNRTSNNSKNNLTTYTRETIFSKICRDSFDSKKKERNFFSRNNFNNISKIKTYEENFKNELKGIIDFSKMSDRNFEIIFNNSILESPSIYHYEPKFDYITQNTKGFIFGNNENKTNFEKKQYLLRKMMCSYGQLSKDYCLIDNSKLKKNK